MFAQKYCLWHLLVLQDAGQCSLFDKRTIDWYFFDLSMRKRLPVGFFPSPIRILLLHQTSRYGLPFFSQCKDCRTNRSCAIADGSLCHAISFKRAFYRIRWPIALSANFCSGLLWQMISFPIGLFLSSCGNTWFITREGKKQLFPLFNVLYSVVMVYNSN